LKPGASSSGRRRPADDRRPGAIRVQPAIGVGEHVELDLADALVGELLVERPVAVLDRGRQLRIEALQRRKDIRLRLHVVAVVRAEDLDLVQPERVVQRVVHRYSGGRRCGRRRRSCTRLA
jgi:hypothetical protein